MRHQIMLTLTVLTILQGVMEAAGQSPPPRPTFDCAKASGEVETLICKDEGLIALDRRMAEVFAAALKKWPAKTAAEERKHQRGWNTERNECANADDMRACVDVTYRMRIVELQIKSGQLKPPPAPVGYTCTGGDDKSLTATLYPQTDPPSALITYGPDRVVAFVARSASGARYTAPNVEFWERDGEATVTWFGIKLACRP